jgi:hypothetical protein
VRTAMIFPGSVLNHSMKRSVVEEGVLVSSGPESTDITGVPPSAPRFAGVVGMVMVRREEVLAASPVMSGGGKRAYWAGSSHSLTGDRHYIRCAPGMQAGRTDSS